MSPTPASPARGAVPFGNLPPLQLSTLPVFIGLFAYVGPGILWAALAQGSGELIFWPYITAKYGAAFLGLLIPAALLQYWLNLEICRYTIVTGETPMTGFSRIGRWFAWFAWILVFVENIWFGAYASAGGTALAALTGFPDGWTPADNRCSGAISPSLSSSAGGQSRCLHFRREIFDGGGFHHHERDHLRRFSGPGPGRHRRVLRRPDPALDHSGGRT